MLLSWSSVFDLTGLFDWARSAGVEADGDDSDDEDEEEDVVVVGSNVSFSVACGGVGVPGVSVVLC